MHGEPWSGASASESPSFIMTRRIQHGRNAIVLLRLIHACHTEIQPRRGYLTLAWGSDSSSEKTKQKLDFTIIKSSRESSHESIFSWFRHIAFAFLQPHSKCNSGSMRHALVISSLRAVKSFQIFSHFDIAFDFTCRGMYENGVKWVSSLIMQRKKK